MAFLDSLIGDDREIKLYKFHYEKDIYIKIMNFYLFLNLIFS